MSVNSKNKISKLKHVRSGLAIYQTGRSPFWFVRFWDPVAKKYVRQSTKETSRIEPTEAAIEFANSYRKNVDPSQAAAKDRNFEAYARKLDAFIVHSFSRSTEQELFGFRHANAEMRDSPTHLVINVHGGKTGYH